MSALLQAFRTITVTAVATLLTPPVKAQETSWTKRDALHETSSEAAQCWAYYGFAQKCADNAGQSTLSGQLQNAIDLASKVQFSTGKAAGMSDQALLASSKMALSAAKASINDSCVNISVLIDKYADPCKRLLEDPDERVQTLMLGDSDPTLKSRR